MADTHCPGFLLTFSERAYYLRNDEIAQALPVSLKLFDIPISHAKIA